MTASFKVDAGGVIIRHTEDQLLSLVAAFIVEAKPGATLVLPSLASLRKDDDGSIIMRNTIWGAVGTRLRNETSDDIVARIKRWSRAL